MTYSQDNDLEAIRSLLEFAACQLVDMGCEYVVESSDRSESRYLYVRRGDTWFGFRLACHIPVYPCSADYQQILIPRYPSKDVLAQCQRFFGRALQEAGNVVADPDEVLEEIALAEETATVTADRASAIRHRLNYRARWVFDVENGGQTGRHGTG